MEEVEKRVIELKPLGKWKRILLFLGDYFITFILAFILFNLVVFPLGKVICNTEKRNDEAESYEAASNELLTSSGFLFKDKQGELTFEKNVNYTFKVFLSYYAFDEENADKSNPQYGHKIENEVIRTYLVSYKNDSSKYLAAFNEVNQADLMFDIGDTVDSISLKNDYKGLLASELLEQQDEDKYTTNMTNFRDHIFARLFYLHVYQDILDNDYVKDGVSYNNCLKQMRDIAKSLQWVPVVSSFISLVLAWSITYLLYPLINKNRRTPTMSAMRLDKLDFRFLLTVKKRTVVLQSFYHLILSASGLLFLPTLYFGMAYTFNLPLLFIFSMISIAFMIGSMIFIFVNEHNRSGSDILTYSVVIPTAELDNLYKEQLDEGRLPS